MRVKATDIDAAIKCSVESRVRFSDLDPMGVMWHGNYVRLFEDAREEFGRRFSGLEYMQMYEAGYTAPIVDMHLQYHSPLGINDIAVTEISFYPEAAARLRFGYRITRKHNGVLVADGGSIQVFTTVDGTMSLVKPEFFRKWEEKWLK